MYITYDLKSSGQKKSIEKRDQTRTKEKIDKKIGLKEIVEESFQILIALRRLTLSSVTG